MERLELNVKLIDSIASVVVEQHFKNNSDNPMECKYKFPVQDTISVTGFDAKIDDMLIVGKLTSKSAATKVYESAKEEGNATAVLHQVSEDMMEMNLGRLAPNASAIVRIQFVQDLTNEVDANNVKFSYPITMVPRYIALSSTEEESKINPTFTTSASYSVHLTMDLNMTSKITGVATSQELKSEFTGPVGKISGQLKTTKDFSIVVECESLDEPVFYLENYHGKPAQIEEDWVKVPENPLEKNATELFLEKTDQTCLSDVALTTIDSQCLSMSFVPQFKLKEIPCELIFLLDRSGSMEGNPTELVRNAMLVFLKSIPENSYFNIIGFGSTFTTLFPTSQKYSESTLKQAELHISTLQADLGGTEILEPLNYIFSTKTIKEYKRQVFILTDGSVSNSQACLEAARKATLSNTFMEKSRVFTLGIGSGVSTQLVNGLAESGEGCAEYVIEGERMEKKCMALLKRALMPSIEKLSIEWLNDKEKSTSTSSINKSSVLSFFSKSKLVETKDKPKYLVLPSQFVIHPSKRLLVQLLVKGELPTMMHLKGQSPDGPIELKLPIKPRILQGKTMHSLAIKRLQSEPQLIRDLHSSADLDNFIIQSCLNFGVSSNKTSWILVFPIKSEGKMTVKEVAMPIPEDRTHFQTHESNSRSRMYAPAPGMAPMGGAPMMSVMSAAPPPASMSYGAAMPDMGLTGSIAPKRSKKMAMPSMPLSKPKMFKSKESSMAPSQSPQALMDKSEMECAGLQLADEEEMKMSAPAMDDATPQLQSNGTLVDFLKYQNFDGFYQTTPEFIKLVGKGKSIVEMKEDLKLNLKDELIVAIYAMAYLKVHFSNQQAEWELSFKKTEKKVSEDIKDVEDVVWNAMQLIQ